MEASGTESMASFATTFVCRPLLRSAAGLALLAVVAASPSRAQSQDAGPVDPRTGSVRIYVSLATSAMTRLVAAMNKHFPNLKIDFVRAGSVERERPFVGERKGG